MGVATQLNPSLRTTLFSPYQGEGERGGQGPGCLGSRGHVRRTKGLRNPRLNTTKQPTSHPSIQTPYNPADTSTIASSIASQSSSNSCAVIVNGGDTGKMYAPTRTQTPRRFKASVNRPPIPTSGANDRFVSRSATNSRPCTRPMPLASPTISWRSLISAKRSAS